jgi:hypothetical protein
MIFFRFGTGSREKQLLEVGMSEDIPGWRVEAIRDVRLMPTPY